MTKQDIFNELFDHVFYNVFSKSCKFTDHEYTEHLAPAFKGKPAVKNPVQLQLVHDLSHIFEDIAELKAEDARNDWIGECRLLAVAHKLKTTWAQLTVDEYNEGRKTRKQRQLKEKF